MPEGLSYWTQLIGHSYLADQLHVTIFNTVVDHLDIVPSTFVTNPLAAWVAITLGSNALEDVLDVRPSFLVTTRHQRRSISSTLLTSGHSGTYESNALGGQVFRTAVGVREVRVTTINNDIASLDVWEKGLNEVVYRLACHDKEHHPTRLLELADKLLDGVGAFDGLACQSPQLALSFCLPRSSWGNSPLASFARK
jgi:hypothetical protein